MKLGMILGEKLVQLFLVQGKTCRPKLVRLSTQIHITYVDLAYTSRKSACNLTEFDYFP